MMKDISVKNIPKETIYKDVVIIGNGPSGIALSYMLAGNWPFWNSDKIQKHPDEMLRARLNYADSSKSLVEQDLITLADGLEGRSTNPVSLLLDSLEHPCADLGVDMPSMIEYRLQPHKQIDHVVLGKGRAGGSWHKMDPNLRTLSLASWMSLPGFTYSDWEMQDLDKNASVFDTPSHESSNELLKQAIINSTNCQKCMELRTKPNHLLDSNNWFQPNEECLSNNNESEPEALCCKCTQKLTKSINGSSDNNEITDQNDMLLLNGIVSRPPRRNLSLKRQVSKEVQTRALVSRVAKYYEDYVYQKNLNKYFVNDTNVTLVAPLDDACNKSEKFSRARWIVTGINETTSRPFYYACRNIVLANGVSDLANRLGLKGEQMHSSWVKHELPQLETALSEFSDNERSKLKPVLVVGAGLSAADAVTICRMSDVHVIHVYRSKTAGLDKMLPENVYPEYHEVHNMMRDSNRTYECYTPIPEHTIANLSTDSNGVHKVVVQNLNTGEQKIYEVSFCAILIGSRPDLRLTSAITKSSGKNSAIASYVNNVDHYASPLGKKMSWLKNICEKCKHFNLCDWTIGSTTSDYGKICGHSVNKSCECSKLLKNNSLASNCSNDDSGIGLGLDATKPIDSKTNQIDVDKYTNELQRVVGGMYALGPLVGDNFVRFIPGGALAITSALHREND